MHISQSQAFVLADVIVVSEPPANRPLGDLNVRCQAPAVENCVSKTRTQSNDHFEAAAGHNTRTRNFCIIEDFGGDAQGTLNSLPHIEVIPLFDELGKNARTRAVFRDVVRSCNNNAVANHSRHSNGHAVSFWKLSSKIDNRLNQQLRRERVRRWSTFWRSNHCSLSIEYRGFNSAAAAIHCQCHLASHSYRLQPPPAFILKRKEQ